MLSPQMRGTNILQMNYDKGGWKNKKFKGWGEGGNKQKKKKKDDAKLESSVNSDPMIPALQHTSNATKETCKRMFAEYR